MDKGLDSPAKVPAGGDFTRVKPAPGAIGALDARPGNAKAWGMGTWRMPAQRLVRALLDRDVGDARRVALDALATSGCRVAVFADLVQPAMAGVGDLWYRGEIDSGDELDAASIVADIARALPATPAARQVPSGSRIVLAALGDERHGIGMELLALALRDEGWQVERLGTRTPPAELLAAVAAHRPHLVGISAGYLPSARPVRDTIAALAARRIRVLVGGQAFNREHGLWRRIGADAYALDARVGVVMARRLLPPAVPALIPRSGRGRPVGRRPVTARS